jgi:hypothetical protein
LFVFVAHMARLFISLQHEKELSARKRTVTATKGMFGSHK